MSPAQEHAWVALLAVTSQIDTGWCLVGGQMVHLYCAERAVAPNRPTEDGDAVLDIRAYPEMLRTFTAALMNLGFQSAGESFEGHQHRWIKGDASIDVLIPSNIGPRAAARKGATGGTAIETPGAQQALARVELVDVTFGSVNGRIPRPNLLGALVIKAAASNNIRDRYRDRHLTDFAVLASMISRSDRLAENLTARDKHHLGAALSACSNRPHIAAQIDGSDRGLEVLAQSLQASSSV